MTKTATEKYQRQQIMTASPARMVAMLFDKAISSLQEAIRAIEVEDIQARWRGNKRAMEIVQHLWATLDMEKGGEIAANLDQIYRFILNRLPQVDMNNDPATAREVIGLLEPLRRSWHEVANRPNPLQAGADPAKTAQPAAKPAQPASGKDEAARVSPGIALSA
jgi:flagellar protein FliS